MSIFEPLRAEETSIHYRHVKTVLERLQVPDRTVGHIMADLEDHDMISEIFSEDRYRELSDIHQRCRKLVGAGEFETPFGRFVGILRHQLNLWEAKRVMENEGES